MKTNNSILLYSKKTQNHLNKNIEKGQNEKAGYLTSARHGMECCNDVNATGVRRLLPAPCGLHEEPAWNYWLHPWDDYQTTVAGPRR